MFTKCVLSSLASLSISSAAFAAPKCELDRPIKLGGLNWGSAEFVNHVFAQVATKAFGCEVEMVPGATIPIALGHAKGNVDVLMEVWMQLAPKAWKKGKKQGKIIDLGPNFTKAPQGWYVPRYVIEGDAKTGLKPIAPNLKSVEQLPEYAHLFKESPGAKKANFYNCMLGWQCEVLNTKKLSAYGLEKHYKNVRLGSTGALDTAILKAYRNQKPVLFYYYGPSYMLAKLDLIELKQPDYNKEVWDKFQKARSPKQSCAAPDANVHVSVTKAFHKAAPRMTQFLINVDLNPDEISQAILEVREERVESYEKAAEQFVAKNKERISKWLDTPAQTAFKAKNAQ